MEHLLPIVATSLIGFIAWIGRRFVDQIDKLAASVTNLSTSVAALQASQKAIWRRLDSMEERKGAE